MFFVNYSPVNVYFERQMSSATLSIKCFVCSVSNVFYVLCQTTLMFCVKCFLCSVTCQFTLTPGYVF